MVEQKKYPLYYEVKRNKIQLLLSTQVRYAQTEFRRQWKHISEYEKYLKFWKSFLRRNNCEQTLILLQAVQLL